jgi:alanine or glycine:cation symporter, AGCS family
MQELEEIISTLSGIVWGPPMLTLLVGTGLYLTIILKGMQFRALPHAFRLIFHKDHGHEGDISHFAALMTALAATVGIGNIVGVATAITLGGPGAVFWMWMTGLVGMATKYSEAVLAVKYREKGAHGMRGGPMYYLAKGVGLPWLGTLFAIFTACATFGIGNMTQANATAKIFESTFYIPLEVTGIALTLMTGLVIIGGIRTIGKFTSFLVPIMIAIYVGCSLWVLALNASEIPHAFGLIFYHAFNPSAATGGFVGATVAAAMRYGIARGVFSNESGLGSAPIGEHDTNIYRYASGVHHDRVGNFNREQLDARCKCQRAYQLKHGGNAWQLGENHCRNRHRAICLFHTHWLELLR